MGVKSVCGEKALVLVALASPALGSGCGFEGAGFTALRVQM